MFVDYVSSLADNVRNVQQQIHCIAKYCLENGLGLNIDKSKIMVFRNEGPVKTFEIWIFNGHDLEVISFYKYLGAMFTSKLSWTKTRDVLSKQATKAILNILKYQKSFGCFTPLEAFKLFDIFVLPILCYSSEIWGYDHSESIEKVHADLCNRVCCLHQTFLAISECVRTPISIVYMSGCVK